MIKKSLLVVILCVFVIQTSLHADESINIQKSSSDKQKEQLLKMKNNYDNLSDSEKLEFFNRCRYNFINTKMLFEEIDELREQLTLRPSDIITRGLMLAGAGLIGYFIGIWQHRKK